MEHYILKNGASIPAVGFGTYWGLTPDSDWCGEAYDAIVQAVAGGYRLLDTASGYFTEREVGRAVRESGVPREDFFITTKMRISEQGYGETLRAFERSLSRLEMDYVDLYMLHWPAPDKYLHTYRAMERLYREGRVRMLGISNFEVKHFEKLLGVCEILPAVHQVELHPRLNQNHLMEYYKRFGVRMQAWSPFGKGNLLRDNNLAEIGRKYQKSAAQVILRWNFQRGVIPLPKGRGEHIRENAGIFDFVLADEEMDSINALHTGERCVRYPDILRGDYPDGVGLSESEKEDL